MTPVIGLLTRWGAYPAGLPLFGIYYRELPRVLGVIEAE